MNLKSIFKVNAIILFLNGSMSLFATQMFLEMANQDVTPALEVIGQFMGVTFLFLSILSWRTPDIAGSDVNAFGTLWGIGGLMWAAIIAYHVGIGVAGGPTAIGNLVITAVFAVLFFMFSRSK